MSLCVAGLSTVEEAATGAATRGAKSSNLNNTLRRQERGRISCASIFYSSMITQISYAKALFISNTKDKQLRAFRGTSSSFLIWLEIDLA